MCSQHISMLLDLGSWHGYIHCHLYPFLSNAETPAYSASVFRHSLKESQIAWRQGQLGVHIQTQWVLSRGLQGEWAGTPGSLCRSRTDFTRAQAFMTFGYRMAVGVTATLSKTFRHLTVFSVLGQTLNFIRSFAFSDLKEGCKKVWTYSGNPLEWFLLKFSLGV